MQLITMTMILMVRFLGVKIMEGKKTYICMGIVALAGVAFAFGLITKDQFEAFAGIFGGLGGMALRAGVTKSGPTV